MKILAFETSCDDTAVALVENGHNILANITASQTEIHQKYGGVVPEIAARNHINIIIQLIDEAIKKSNYHLKDIDAFAATAFHGLSGSLLIGMMTAKTLSYIYSKPFIGINHIEAHIYANFIENKNLPIPHICLTVSGGHTILVVFKGHNNYQVIGQTVDDAAGEAFDKLSQYLQLGYPGGPIIDKLAKNGNPEKYKLPRPMIKKNNFLFSFSGLKTATLNLIKNLKHNNENYKIEDIAASFQKAVVDTLVTKTIKAAKKYNIKTITLSGGVAANSMLREEFQKECIKNNINFFYPQIKYCTDNAVMVGTLAYYKLKNGYTSKLDTNVIANTLL